MLKKVIQDALNEQVKIEAQSSQVYLAMASWAEIQPGIDNITSFFYRHSDEERMHMLKLIKYINERGGFAMIPALEQPQPTFPSIKHALKELLKHEEYVSESINKVVDISLAEKDYATYNFMQWYVSEQIEEESLARTLNDKLELIGEDKSGLYLFDKDILMVNVTTTEGK
ncbi:MAG TPA: ferritin [Saprospiraceae bacterium]|mgnify:CR=1 FL=1|nr:ferritin [Saprospiraceae bacterium]